MNESDPTPTAAYNTSTMVPALSNETTTDMALIQAGRNPKIYTTLLFRLTSYAIVSCLCFALVAYLRRNRSSALKGDSTAARKIILPAFEPLLWIIACTTCIFSIGVITVVLLDLFETGFSVTASEIFYCGRQFEFLLIIMFMHQKSVSIPALRRCVMLAFLLAIYPMPFAVYTEFYGVPDRKYLYYIIEELLHLPLVLWYVYICVRPPSRATKKTIREFCGFMFFYQVLNFTASELFRADSALGYVFLDAALLWAVTYPFFIWRVLQADTEHWRGMGQRACDLQDLFRQKNQIHEHTSSQGLHVLIEMHRNHIIDFAYLETRKKIGVGASADVFNGVLYSRIPVAIKVYTPNALSDEVVASFSHEAALCGALDHPNIVTFYGMCVCPPTICLVFELCQGSLEDILIANQRRAVHANRQQLMVNVGYMIDAARAVAYLHSFSPGFLHRDIKPANFLVDSEHNVKLTDFGESRSIVTSPPVEVSGGGKTIDKRGEKELYHDLPGVIVPSPSALPNQRPTETMTVKGTVDYMAPELINGKGGFASYGEAADVYSLAMTMWDILHPGEERYPTCSRNHLYVFQAVLDGKRPQFSARVLPTLQDVISNAWHVDPRMRPSAQLIVSMLESIQEEVCASFLFDSYDEFASEGLAVMAVVASDKSRSTRSNSSDDDGGDGLQSSVPANSTFSGSSAVAQLRSNHYVSSVGEALRMGHMWMDAGFLHHVKHARGFTNDEAEYYLDEDQIRLCQPFADYKKPDQLPSLRPPSSIGGATNGSSTRSDSSSGRINGALQRKSDPYGAANNMRRAGVCACRKHGQRRVDSGVKRPNKKDRFKRKKFTTIAEETTLTMSLLMQAEGPAQSPTSVDFVSHHRASDFNSYAKVATLHE